MRDNLIHREDELLPIEREHTLIVALALACWAVLLVLAGWSMRVIWVATR